MKITWLAHASFLIEGDGRRIITDPYHPEEMGFPWITEPADIVIRSSSDDLGHCFAEMIAGEPEVVTATEIIETGAIVKGLRVTAIPVLESIIHKDSPLDNGMYRFTVGGIEFGHMGDVGNPLTEDQLAGLRGVDILLALAGGAPTIDIPDLVQAIKVINPRVVIPMHYRLPGTTLKMLPVTELTNHFSDEAVTWVGSSEIEFTPDSLPTETQVYVLESSLVK